EGPAVDPAQGPGLHLEGGRERAVRRQLGPRGLQSERGRPRGPDRRHPPPDAIAVRCREPAGAAHHEAGLRAAHPQETCRHADAQRAGELLKAEGFTFDVAFTSVLKRAIRTLWIALDELDLMWIPVEHSWRLNERHYGALQGLNKAQTAAKYGEEQVRIWRRS